jgi:two-component system cell cycle response regulator DivK
LRFAACPRPCSCGVRDGSRDLVLVVDDHASFVEALDKGLSDDYIALTALDGLEGYALACQYHPDAMIFDLMMPLVDGATVLQKIRSNATLSALPVIVITGLEVQTAEAEVARFQVAAVLHKPCELRDVKAALGMALHA